MKITDFTDKNRFFVSCEIIPPKRGYSLDSLYNSIEVLVNNNVKFLSVTKHQPIIDYIETYNGIKKIIKTKHPGTVGIASMLKNKFNVEPVPHLICAGYNKYELEDILIDLDYMDIENLFVIRGDADSRKRGFSASENGYKYAYQLVKHIKSMNDGNYDSIYSDVALLDQDVNNKSVIEKGESIKKNNRINKTNFCIGVAGYPEKHYESLNVKDDLDNLQLKILSGADFIITQIFFSADVYINFVKKLRRRGINVPVIPGIKPVVRFKNLRKLVSTFNITIPQKLVNMLDRARSEKEEIIASIKYIESMIEKLIDFGIPGIHFFTMRNSSKIESMLKSLSTVKICNYK